LTSPYKNAIEPETAKGTYAFVSLGCPKNTVDSERMMGLLQLDGYQMVGDPAESDFVIVNTCGFIEQARKESYAAIDEMLDLKRKGKTRGVIVSGCLAERQKEEMLQERPDIDSLVGVFGREEITKVADRLLGDLAEQRSVFQPAPVRALDDRNRFRITPQHFAYLKISEGCDRLCTFCAIPKMRGKHASKPIEQIIDEAKQLVDQGVRELNIVAQDTTYYGMDVYGEPRLRQLLEQMDQIEGLDWIRLMYFYPMYVDQPLLDTIASAQRILPYIDMPLQHINDTMLKRMSRRVNRKQVDQLLIQMRESIENLVMRTTFITGFPGETDEQFEELAEFIRDAKFERLGVFTYSYEPDTPAALLPNHLDEETKIARRDRLMEIQHQNSIEWNQNQIGRKLDVMIDRSHPEQPDVWIGRSYADAPDIDGLVFVNSARALIQGEIVASEIVAAEAYDLIGVSVD
jgi:ribosomal protein S12 methylthiotransferase